MASQLSIPYGQKHSLTLVDAEGQPINPIAPRGYDGAGLWHFALETENSVEPVYALVEIQHSYDQFYESLIEVPIDLLIEAISKNCDFNFERNSSASAT